MLIFTRTRATADQVAGHLHAAGMRTGVLHAEKTQRARQDTLDQFRAGTFPYLVATDVAARGIDVTSISHVINFDLPTKADDYLHRIGRTGRMERSGHAISLMTKADIRAVREIERMLGSKIEVAQLEVSDNEKINIVIPVTREVAARPPQHHVTFPNAAAKHPFKRHTHDEEERPRRAQYADAPPRLPAQPAPAPDERPRKRRVDTAPPNADRSQRRSYADTPPAREERSRKRSGNERSTERPARPERADRRRRDNEASAVPKRWERTVDNGFADDATAGTPRRQRPGGKPFTGMADVAKYNRKHATGKRQPGEVPSGPRPSAKSTPAQQPAATYAPRAKRLTGRGR